MDELKCAWKRSERRLWEKQPGQPMRWHRLSLNIHSEQGHQSDSDVTNFSPFQTLNSVVAAAAAASNVLEHVVAIGNKRV